ncbi:MAG TPA: arylsulfatase [Gemmataceae bacterium]|nr:arylsulfatase [Gemmataceae bacterium]
MRLPLTLAACCFLIASPCHAADNPPARPNVIVIVADDLGFSDLACYGSEIATPNLDKLAADGVRFTQFYNCARCCPTRAALLTGLYPHQAGVGHMLESWKPKSYSTGLGPQCATIAELLHVAGYRNYHVGKWHVGSLGNDPKLKLSNHPLDRGFDRAYGTGGGGNYFAPNPLYLDRKKLEPGDDYYITDALTDFAVQFLTEDEKGHKTEPFFLHLCYTAPHFPLQAKPADIAKYQGQYREGWDKLREQRFARQKALGIMPASAELSPRDPEARAWAEVPQAERGEWDQRMAVYAAMIDCMDQGIGKVLQAVKKLGVEKNTLVLFFSDNGASAESLDSWPNRARGHKPGSVIGTRESHRCLEVGWANAANTPFREHKMWIQEGGIATPLIARWPAGIKSRGTINPAVGHVIDLMPTCLELAKFIYPANFHDRPLTPLEGKSLVPVLRGEPPTLRILAWEHEGNRGLRVGNWKVVGSYEKPWELYDLTTDRSECHNQSEDQPGRLKALVAEWQRWADRVGVVSWEKLPGASYKPSIGYRKKSERLDR